MFSPSHDTVQSSVHTATGWSSGSRSGACSGWPCWTVAKRTKECSRWRAGSAGHHSASSAWSSSIRRRYPNAASPTAREMTRICPHVKLAQCPLKLDRDTANASASIRASKRAIASACSKGSGDPSPPETSSSNLLPPQPTAKGGRWYRTTAPHCASCEAAGRRHDRQLPRSEYDRAMMDSMASRVALWRQTVMNPFPRGPASRSMSSS